MAFPSEAPDAERDVVSLEGELASAAVERHVALGVADVPGGTAVFDLIAKEVRLNATLQTLESELPDVRTRLVEELTPLEHAASKTKEISDPATAQIAAIHGSMGATAKEFILSILGSPESASGSLGSLTGIKDARRLSREVEVLSQELAELEQRASLG